MWSTLFQSSDHMTRGRDVTQVGPKIFVGTIRRKHLFFRGVGCKLELLVTICPWGGRGRWNQKERLILMSNTWIRHTCSSTPPALLSHI